jgi:hypothetical protein
MFFGIKTLFVWAPCLFLSFVRNNTFAHKKRDKLVIDILMITMKKQGLFSTK